MTSVKRNKDLVSLITFAPSKRKDLIQFLSDTIDAIEDDHKKIDNYKNNPDFVLDEQLLITVALMDGKCVAFSSVYKRDSYPKNCARILNRYYIDPSHRENSNLSDINWLAFEMAKDQIDQLRNTNLEIDWAFMSMEAPKPRWMTHWVNTAKEHGLEFHFNRNILHLTCPIPGPQKKFCWQHVCYLNIRNKNALFPMVNNSIISLDEWRDICG